MPAAQNSCLDSCGWRVLLFFLLSSGDPAGSSSCLATCVGLPINCAGCTEQMLHKWQCALQRGTGGCVEQGRRPLGFSRQARVAPFFTSLSGSVDCVALRDALRVLCVDSLCLVAWTAFVNHRLKKKKLCWRFLYHGLRQLLPVNLYQTCWRVLLLFCHPRVCDGLASFVISATCLFLL